MKKIFILVCSCALLAACNNSAKTIKGAIGRVKNPQTGCITAESYGEIILDENIKAPADCELRLWEEKRERPITCCRLSAKGRV